MFTIALVALAVAAAACGSTGAIVRHLIRQQARERQLLIDQVCHLAGRTWTPPPAETFERPPVADDGVVRRFEHYPDGYDFDAAEAAS